MKTFLRFLKISIMTILLSFFSVGCSSSSSGIKISDQDIYYTKCNMYAYKGKIDTVNYTTGIFIPVNSKVKILASNRKRIKFIYNNETFYLINRKKYTNKNIDQIFSRYFSTKKVDLSKFTKKERDAIKTGKVVKGMSKEAVLIALGHPPAHATPSLESNEWKYWKNRWNTMIVVFKNDKVIAIRD